MGMKKRMHLSAAGDVFGKSDETLCRNEPVPVVVGTGLVALDVVLTDRKCKGYPGLNEAYTYTNSVYLDGCWTVIDGKVHVAWGKNQGRKVYEINDFVPDQVTPKKTGVSL